MTTAIQHFEATFARAFSQLQGSFHVLDAFNENREEGEEEYTYNSLNEASDMGRFGIVLAVASMDDYFTRKYAEVMVRCIKKNGVNKKFVEMLEQAGLSVAGALELISLDRPYRRIRKIAQDHYRNYTTQSTEKIDSLYETIGISGLCEHARRRSGKKTLLSSVSELVQRRHKIVHSGDLTTLGRLQKIDSRTVRRIPHLQEFVQKADEHIDAFLLQKPKKMRKGRKL
jgi:hypothetical protein